MYSKLSQATAQLNKEYYKNPACIPALTTILTMSPEAPVRIFGAQLASETYWRHNRFVSLPQSS